MPDLRAFFRERKLRLGVLSGSGVLVLAGILAAANLLSQTLFTRWDWTADHRYSLSPASKKLVRSLPDPLLLRFYLSPGLPQPYETQGRYLRDLLGEYRAAAKGKIRLEILNPEESEKTKAEATRAGVAPVRFTQVASDQFQIREAFMGLVLFYQDKQEVVPFIKDTQTMEYDISSRIKKMSAAKKRALGLVTGHGEVSLYELQPEGSTLFEGFDAQPVQLSTESPVNADVLLILGPRQPFSPTDLKILDGYLARGAPLIITLSRQMLNLRSFTSLVQKTELEPFLQHYGVRLETDVVLDAQCQRITLQSQQGQFSVANILNYPAIPLSNRLDKNNPVLRTVDALGFPFAHPLLPVDGQSTVRFTPLAESSPNSWISPGLSRFDPYNIPGPGENSRKGPFVLAALVE
ncbi:MAG TPA: GldG family protein, partial [Elusimicrobiota bacterium]|nr:GldG family protein [Elusimicrobiota bacterium]